MTRRKVAAESALGAGCPVPTARRVGTEISDFLPHTAELADELCVLRGCHGDSVNHPQSVYQMNTGSILMGRPSLGSWVTYGLGTENYNLPAFVVLMDPGGGVKGGPPAWGHGYLPATYQGTTFRTGATPIVDLRPQPSVSAWSSAERSTICGLLDQRHAEERHSESAVEARHRGLRAGVSDANGRTSGRRPGG